MRLSVRVKPFSCVLAVCILARISAAATSTAWEVSGFDEFLKGRLKGLSLSADGLLRAGPSLKWSAGLDQPSLWSLAAAPDGSVYAATGNQGKVFHIAADGKLTTLWSAEQTQVFAVGTTAQGTVYAGSSPNGGLYRLQNGKGDLVWKSPVKYIWAIQAAPDGTLYVATGEQGRVYRIATNGKADIYYETGQANVTALALGPNGHLYAGTDPNGIVYDISGINTGTVLYDSTLPEIRAIAVDSIGTVYIAAMGGAVSTRTTTGTTTTGTGEPVVATTPTVITVTEQSGMKITPDTGKTSTSTSSTAATSNTAVTEVSGVEKSAIYRIAPNHAIETLRSSKEDNVFDLIVDNGAVLFTTDDHGRVYRLAGVGMHKTTLIAEPGDGVATRLLQTKAGLFAGLSNPARVVGLGAEASGPGSYESQIHDSTSVARWGHLQWHGTGSGLVFRTRTGNSTRPDATWSAWSAPITDPDQALIQSPPARFIQWRAEWPAGNQSEINTVSVPYLSQNSPPAIHSLTVSSVVGTNPAKSVASASSSTAAYSVTVTDTGEPPATSTSTTNTQTVSRLQTTQTQISWQADDPDSDKLVYTIYFRAEDEKEWQLIRSRMFENTLLLDPDVFADGRYFFKVMASDAPSNAFEFALETEMVSTPVLIDNTPPVVMLGKPLRHGNVIEMDVDAADKTSPLRLCEFSMDAGLWQPVESEDGVTDSPHERFHLRLENVRPGEHLLVVRVYDSANNAGLARVVVP